MSTTPRDLKDYYTADEVELATALSKAAYMGTTAGTLPLARELLKFVLPKMGYVKEELEPKAGEKYVYDPKANGRWDRYKGEMVEVERIEVYKGSEVYICATDNDEAVFAFSGELVRP